jgi:FkbM family methyltransferase
LAFNELERLRGRFPTRMKSYNVAIGAHEDDLPIFFGEEASPLASLSKEVNFIDYVGRSNVNSIMVPVRTLDGFADEIATYSQQIDLIKIDTEGYEWEVLMGAMNLISDFRPKFIQIEFNAHHLFRKRTLLEIGEVLPGYILLQLLPYGSGMVERNLLDPFSNFFAFSNFVFVREENLGDLTD